MLLNARRIPQPPEKPKIILLAIEDITERIKKTDEVLQESEERFRTIFEKSGVSKALTSPKGRLIKVNQAFANLLGYSIKEMQKIDFFKITHPDDIAISRKSISTLLAGEKTIFHFEKRYIHKNGSIVWADVSTTLLRNKDNKPLYFVTSIVDITGRKKMEQQLIEEKAKDEAILTSICDAVFVVDKNLKIIMFNQAAEKITNRRAAEVMGKNYHKVLHFVSEKDDKIKNLFTPAAMSNGQIKQMVNHTMLVLKDGKKIPVAESASPVRDINGNILGFVIVFRDISREREIAQAKDDFLSIAAHDLRTPMSGIRANTEMILGGDYGKIPSKFKIPLQDIDRANLNLIKMIDDFLTLSRIEKGKITIIPKPMNILPVLNSIVKQVRPSIEKRNLRFNFKIPTKLPRVMADADKISEVITNLLDNAIKFTDKGSIGLKVLLKKDSVVVVVADTGVGIAKERQKDLFEKYTQVGAEKRIAHGKGTGLGLGLYIARLIVEGCKGKIWVESILDKGSTFYFSLPIVKNKKISN